MNIHKWTVGWCATFVALAGVFLCSTGRADASFSDFSFSSGFKAGEVVEGIAIDESTNDVYAYETNGTIYKFDENGDPVDFSGLGSNKITGTGVYGNGETELAVDNSSGPAKGDIYLAGGAGVKVYGADGSKLGELTEVSGRPWGEVACGVAVDGSGGVYVGLYLAGVGASNIDKYTPTTNPVTNSDYTGFHGGLNEICQIASDHEGNVYASTWRNGQTVKIEGFQAGGTKLIAPHTSNGAHAVANSPSAELFIGDGNEILQYDSSGNQLSTFGAGEAREYFVLAFNAKNGKLYAFNARADGADGGEGRSIEIWQGVLTPDVKTTQATNLNPTGSATLNGSVNPEEVSVETCAFKYGLTTEYSSEEPCAQAVPLTGSSTLPVSADLTGVALNQTYHYRLTTSDTHGTVNGVDQMFTVLVKPTVEDQPSVVSAIARASAKLTGTVNPEQAETSYRFEYGTTESYGSSTPFAPAGSGASDATVGQQLGELLPETTYHYRLVAKNIAGTVVGTDHTFTTGASMPPAAMTGASSGVTQNTAIITGAINTNGLPTTYGFEVATSTDYGPPTGLGAVGAGSDEAPAALALTGLLPGTTYHYRLTATNLDGTSYGTDQTFTTGVFTNTFATPPAPLPFVAVPAVAFPQEATGSSTTTPKALTRAQKLAAALKACHKKAKSKRAGCERQARKKYGAAKQKSRKK